MDWGGLFLFVYVFQDDRYNDTEQHHDKRKNLKIAHTYHPLSARIEGKEITLLLKEGRRLPFIKSAVKPLALAMGI